jgi:hypothetical protein
MREIERATSGLDIAGIVDPPGENNDCGFCCLLLVLVEAVASERVGPAEMASHLERLRGADRIL